jgi:hypothetical protein
VFVYRDPELAADSGGEHDGAYWYDLPAAEAEAAAVTTQAPEPIRGPFEPLVSSHGQAPAGGDGQAVPGPAAPGTAQPHAASAAEPPEEPGAGGGHEDSADVRERKLEQIKDFYLTAEAIGEENVDRHFDELMAHQRALISEYFRQSGTTPGTAGPAESATAEPAEPAEPAGPAGPAEPGAGIAAEQPRAW